MNITHAMNKYDNMTGNLVCICATVDKKEVSIPIDPANRHYAEIMRQVAEEGLVIAEPD